MTRRRRVPTFSSRSPGTPSCSIVAPSIGHAWKLCETADQRGQPGPQSQRPTVRALDTFAPMISVVLSVSAYVTAIFLSRASKSTWSYSWVRPSWKKTTCSARVRLGSFPLLARHGARDRTTGQMSFGHVRRKRCAAKENYCGWPKTKS